DFNSYLMRVTGRRDVSKISSAILEICNYNSFLQKLGAGQLFSRLIKSTEIDQYLNRQPKTVYLDASVIIYIVCFLLNENSEYNNIYFSVAKDLINYNRNGQTRLN